MSETNLILVISNNQLKVAQSSILGDQSKDECKKILDFVQKISNDNLVMKQFQSQLNKCQFIQDKKMKFTIQKNELDKLLCELKSNNPIFTNKELISRLTKELYSIEPKPDSTFVQYFKNHQKIEEDIVTLGKHDYATMELKVLIGAYKDLLKQNYILSDHCGANIFEQILSSKLDTIYLGNNIQSLKYLENNLFIYLVNLDKKQVEIYYQYTVPNLLDSLDPMDKDEQSSVLGSIIKQLANLDAGQDIKLLNIFNFSYVANNSVNQLVNDLYQLID